MTQPRQGRRHRVRGGPEGQRGPDLAQPPRMQSRRGGGQGNRQGPRGQRGHDQAGRSRQQVCDLTHPLEPNISHDHLIITLIPCPSRGRLGEEAKQALRDAVKGREGFELIL